MRLLSILCALALGTIAAGPAKAAELFGGIHVHDVKTPLDKSGIEDGVDVSLGYRGSTITHLFHGELQPYFFGALNTAEQTHYAAAGISAKFGLGGNWYIRPGLGIAIHSGSAGKFFRTDRVAFGSRVLAEPELGIGTKIRDRVTVEASWVHMSHAQLFGGENPGMDNLGFRLNVAL